MRERNSIDAALVAAIEASGKSAWRIAKDLHDEPNASTIRNLLAGRNSPTTTSAARLADYLGLELRQKN